MKYQWSIVWVCTSGLLSGPVYTESRVNESGFIFHKDRIFHCVHMEPGSEKFACITNPADRIESAVVYPPRLLVAL